ncbi:hypothetical protein C2E23DRAFT_769862 [Lenzites betulinus]|nr:hypothetical protein C2E23DRAFT_769862 [Lenzites betulinus]
MSTVLATPQPVWLKPRPLARTPSSFLLLPLLPSKPPLKPLPSEIWAQILQNAFAFYDPGGPFGGPDAPALRTGLLLISKDIHAAALPLLYTHINIPSLQALAKLTARLHTADAQWDSIRRIPYSAPGRWIRTLDISTLCLASSDDAFHLDAFLNTISRMVPFMSTLVVNPQFAWSQRTVSSLADREGANNLRVLKGVRLRTSLQYTDDPFVELLRACTRLEELDISGSGVDLLDLVASRDITPPPAHFLPLHLPFLSRLTILSMPTSPALYALLHSPLPALRRLTLTPYDDHSVPSSLTSRFISTHGVHLTSLYLHVVKQWPTAVFPSPTTLLDTCPSLEHLSLELPLPALTLTVAQQHHLKILSVPRPTSEFLVVLERLLPKLPHLCIVRSRDVKWLRGGMSERAQQAGVQGEMQYWKRKLGRRRIQLLDAEWKSGTE